MAGVGRALPPAGLPQAARAATWPTSCATAASACSAACCSTPPRAGCPAGDEWIGWQDEPYHAHLQLVVRNALFLLLPWVQVKNLASHALALAARQLPADWHKLHRSRPVLLETYVNAEQHAGTCYKAAGWQLLGLTAGRKAHGRQPAQAPKQVWALPLRPDFRKLLRHGPFAGRRRRRGPAAAPVHRAVGGPAGRDRGPAAPLRPGVDAAPPQSEHAARRAVRLPPCAGPPAARLWPDAHRTVGPVPAAGALPAPRRSRLRLLDVRGPRPARPRPHRRTRWLWRGHRVFAVDGSKIHRPRRLRRDRYRCPSDRSHYPQGLLSTLFQLRARLPCDLDLSCHENERRAARDHLRALRPGDVVVCDRGYYSFALLHAWRPARFVKYTRRRQRLHPRDHPARPQALLQARPGRLYHARWGVEEHYKVVKRLLRLEPFHGQSEDLVLQELWACFTLIAMTRLFASHCEAEMPSAAGKPPLRANFNNSLRTVSQHVEWLLLQQSAALSTTVDSILRSMDCCRQRERPNRSYPRVTRRPDDRWRPSKKK